MMRTTLLLRIVLVGVLILTSAGSAGWAAAQDAGGQAKVRSPNSLPFDGLSCPLSLTHPAPCSGVSEIPLVECQALVSLYREHQRPWLDKSRGLAGDEHAVQLVWRRV